jgi:hypothetical protein
LSCTFLTGWVQYKGKNKMDKSYMLGNHFAKKGRSGVYVRTPEMKTGKNPNSRNGFKKGHIDLNPTGKGRIQNGEIQERNRSWKGENAGYVAKHVWIKTLKGNPKYCENCGVEGKKVGWRWNLDWANVDHAYKRILDDYIGLCRLCHKNYDLKRIQLRKINYGY